MLRLETLRSPAYTARELRHSSRTLDKQAQIVDNENMNTYEYSVGDEVRGDDGCVGVVTYTDPESGGVVRWDDGEETDYTWIELGSLTPNKGKIS